jgi:hypothetical protein
MLGGYKAGKLESSHSKAGRPRVWNTEKKKLRTRIKADLHGSKIRIKTLSVKTCVC